MKKTINRLDAKCIELKEKIAAENANLASKPFVDPAILADPAVYPDATAVARLYTPLPQTPDQESDMNRAWSAIKTGG